MISRQTAAHLGHKSATRKVERWAAAQRGGLSANLLDGFAQDRRTRIGEIGALFRARQSSEERGTTAECRGVAGDGIACERAQRLRGDAILRIFEHLARRP